MTLGYNIKAYHGAKALGLSLAGFLCFQSPVLAQSSGITLIEDGTLNDAVHNDADQDGTIKDTKTERQDPFAALLKRRGPSAIKLSNREPLVYETTEGDETFVFQAMGNTALIRFLCDEENVNDVECQLLDGQRGEEVYLLTATRSPRGDVIYKDVDGEAVLRVTSNGGATLFRPGLRDAADGGTLAPSGGIAVLPITGVTASLKAPNLQYEQVEERMRLASDIFIDRYGTQIFFQAPGPDNGSQAVLADAILTTTKGLHILASDELGARVMAEQLDTVSFVPGEKSSIFFKNGTLSVMYNIEQDIKGRPSSAAVARYLESVL